MAALNIGVIVRSKTVVSVCTHMLYTHAQLVYVNFSVAQPHRMNSESLSVCASLSYFCQWHHASDSCMSVLCVFLPDIALLVPSSHALLSLCLSPLVFCRGIHTPSSPVSPPALSSYCRCFKLGSVTRLKG